MLAVGLNGDGKTDLVFGGAISNSLQSHGIGVSFGSGDATFQSEVIYQTGSDVAATSIALGDFTGDHILDVATLGESGVWLFVGQGGGLFNPGVLTPIVRSGNYAYSLSPGDLNSDGELDLVASTQTGFAVLLGNGDGTFRSPLNTSDSFQGLSTGMSLDDLNGDGRPDVVLVSSLYPYVLVYLGNGDGTFATPSKVSLPGNYNVAIGDVNGDRIPDLISDGVYIARGRGDGTFRPPVYFAVSSPPTGGAWSVMAADLRNTGRLDIVAINLFSSISVLLNQGGGRYNEGLWVPVTGGGAGCAAAMDFNRDGTPDLAVTVSSGISLLPGTGTAARPFMQGAIVPLTNAACVLAADVNGDGIRDLVAETADPPPSSGGTVTVLAGNGDGTFTQKSINPVADLGWLAVGDFNGDGKLDFAMSSNLLAYGNGDGTFRTPASFVPNVLPTTQVNGFAGIAAEDLNGDGRTDIVLTDAIDNCVYVLMADGSGGFQQTVFSTWNKVHACGLPWVPVLGDVNQDGRVDLVLGCVDGLTPIYLNDGTGRMGYRKSLKESVVSDVMLPLISDFNGDGVPDVAVLTNNDVVLYFGKGGLNYSDPIYLGTGTLSSAILTMNLHGQTPLDGKPDIVIPDNSGQVLVMLNLTR